MLNSPVLSLVIRLNAEGSWRGAGLQHALSRIQAELGPSNETDAHSTMSGGMECRPGRKKSYNRP